MGIRALPVQSQLVTSFHCAVVVHDQNPQRLERSVLDGDYWQAKHDLLYIVRSEQFQHLLPSLRIQLLILAEGVQIDAVEQKTH